MESPIIKSPKYPLGMMRLWKPHAQRNLRNQWSKLDSLRQEWISSSSSGRSYATSLVNSYLSHKYMGAMDLGVLSDMPNIRKKACYKLLKQHELQQSQLLASYKDMVAVVIGMVSSSISMRCFVKGSSASPLVHFSNSSENNDDDGDGGGIPVFTFWPISTFEVLAKELVEMFKLEVILKRLLVVELFSISCQKIEQLNQLSWADELYPGEADDLSTCNLYCKETLEPFLPKVNCRGSRTSSFMESDKQPNHKILQVYLTTWLAEVNIDTYRVEEIFAIVGQEMHTSFS